MFNIGKLDDMPRTPLFGGTTPLEFMPNLTRSIGGASLWVKRDDLTELAFGGNKVRQLEFYMGQAVQRDSDTILITGAVQSNFVRLAAAAANKLGMQCHIQLEQRVAKEDALYIENGNVLLDKMLGATLHYYPEGEDEEGADANLKLIAEQLTKEGRKPYIIPLSPGHPPYGALGYVIAAIELKEQTTNLGISLDQIIVASGSGATHGGLLFGLRAIGMECEVIGICVRRAASLQKTRIESRCEEIAHLLGVNNPVSKHDVVVDDHFLAPGYGVAGEAVKSAISTAAKLESIMLDPTYSGKTFAGAMAYASENQPDRHVLFMHTGGTPAIFAYQHDLECL